MAGVPVVGATHYDVLGIDPEAPVEQVKRAYYRRARRLHPDAHAGATEAVVGEAARAMAALNQAWNGLRDPVSRAAYDEALRLASGQAAELPRPALGGGFRYFMGVSSSGTPGDDGRPRLNLAIDGATDLSPLAAFAPDRLWGLHAEQAGIGDAQLVHVRNLHGLQYLDLSRTGVTDAGLVHLEGLERLETLHVWDTAVTDAGLPFLGMLTSLRLLGLGNTAVTDAGLAHLRNLTNLRVLQLWGTDVRGPGLAQLRALPHLEVVTLPRRVRPHHRWHLRRHLH